MACLWWAFLLLCLPINWIMACVAAALVHEMGHAVAVYFMGGSIRTVRIGMAGAIIHGDCLTYGREILCSLMGPLFSLLCFLWIRIFPWFALCGLIHGLYNLLPMYPLDGGRALLAMLRFSCRKDPIRLFFGIQIVFGILLAVACIHACVHFWLGLSVLLPLLPAVFGKIPCKDDKIGLQ